MSLPFVWIVLSFIFGIIFSKYFHPTLFLIYLIAFFSFPFLICKKKKVFFLVLIVLAGAFAYRNSLSYSVHNIANLSPASDVHIIATIVKPPIEKTTSYGKKIILIGQAEEAGKEKVRGLLKATIYKPFENYCYGDRLLLKGKLYRPYNFGGFDYKKYLATQRIHCLFSAKAKDVHVLSHNSHKRNLLFSSLFRIKEILANIIDKNLSSREASLLKAILLGERSNISSQLKEIFINTGTIHILSISGLHIGIIATIFFLFFKFLRLPYRAYYLLTIIFIILYAILSGARVPVVRATILAVTILVGRLLNRPCSIYNSLGFAAFLILVVQPLYLFDPGFQLSFLCVFFIIYLTPKIEKVSANLSEALASGRSHGSAKPREATGSRGKLRTTRFRRVRRFVVGSFSASLAVWLGIVPLISYYFKSFVPITVLANLVMVPLLFFIIANGFLLILFAAIPVSAAIFGAIEIFLLAILIKNASFFSDLPFSHFHFSLTLLGVFSYYFLLFLFTEGFNRVKCFAKKEGKW